MRSVIVLLVAARAIAIVVIVPSIQLRQEYVFLPSAVQCDGVEYCNVDILASYQDCTSRCHGDEGIILESKRPSAWTSSLLTPGNYTCRRGRLPVLLSAWSLKLEDKEVERLLS